MEELEDEQNVIRILGCQNHYQVLEIPINASDEEILEAYKKWARLVHPDKNHAPQANEAMKKVTKAREILTNSNKRMLYDQSFMGAQIPQQPNDDDDEDDELFNMNRNDHHPFPECHNWWATEFRICLLISLPVILLLLLPAIVNLLKPYSIYSLTPNAKLMIRRRTMAGKIPYYVTKDFSFELQNYYNGSLGDLEREVKNAYKTKLERACKREQKYKQDAVDAAHNSPNDRYWYERFQQAKSLGTPSCAKLQFLADILNQPNDYVSKIWKYFTVFTKFL